MVGMAAVDPFRSTHFASTAPRRAPTPLHPPGVDVGRGGGDAHTHVRRPTIAGRWCAARTALSACMPVSAPAPGRLKPREGEGVVRTIDLEIARNLIRNKYHNLVLWN